MKRRRRRSASAELEIDSEAKLLADLCDHPDTLSDPRWPACAATALRMFVLRARRLRAMSRADVKGPEKR